MHTQFRPAPRVFLKREIILFIKRLSDSEEAYKLRFRVRLDII